MGGRSATAAKALSDAGWTAENLTGGAVGLGGRGARRLTLPRRGTGRRRSPSRTTRQRPRSSPAPGLDHALDGRPENGLGPDFTRYCIKSDFLVLDREHVARATPRSRNHSKRVRNEPRNASPRIVSRLFHFLRNLASWIGGHSGSEAEANGSLRRHTFEVPSFEVPSSEFLSWQEVEWAPESRSACGPGTRCRTGHSGVGADRAADLGVDVTMPSALPAHEVSSRPRHSHSRRRSVCRDSTDIVNEIGAAMRQADCSAKPVAAPSGRDNPRGWDVNHSRESSFVSSAAGSHEAP